MALDPEISDLLKTQMMGNGTASAQRVNLAGENAAQALTVIQNTVIQAQASNADDPGLFAALATSSRVPASGALPAAT